MSYLRNQRIRVKDTAPYFAGRIGYFQSEGDGLVHLTEKPTAPPHKHKRNLWNEKIVRFCVNRVHCERVW